MKDERGDPVDFIKLSYGRILQMAYQPKRVDKIADFETLTRLYLPKFKSNVYLVLQGLTYGYYLYRVKNSIPNGHPFSN